MSNEQTTEMDSIGELLDETLGSLGSGTTEKATAPHTSPIYHAIPVSTGKLDDPFDFKWMTLAEWSELRASMREHGIDEWPLPPGWTLPTVVEAETASPVISKPRRARSKPAMARNAGWKGKRDENGYLEKLQRIVDEMRNGTTAYPALREQYLMLNEALNRTSNVPAPAFRPRIERAWLGETPEGTALFVDQQVIDMHWLLCQGCEFEPSAGTAYQELKKSGISSMAAQEFAGRKWEMPAKCAALNATALQRYGCNWILDLKLRKQRQNLARKSKRHLRMLETRQLEGAIAERRSLERIDPYRVASAWLARELARLSGAPLSNARVANYFKLVTGEPASRSAVGNQLDQVARHIGAL